MGADYYFHPHGTLPGDVDEDAVERRRLVALIDQLQEQLKATEKAYDASLQQNLLLQDRIAGRDRQLRMVDESLGWKGTGMGRVEAIQALKEVGEPSFSDFGSFQATNRVREKVDRDLDATPLLPVDPQTEWDTAAVDKAIAEINEEARKTSESVRAQQKRLRTDDPYSSRGVQPADMLSEMKRAQGDRAKMKDTLVRTQNACRRYKARLKRQGPQLEALQDVANTAVPLYELLLNAGGEFVLLPRPENLTKLLGAFDEAFDKAAEVLTPLEVGYE